MQIFNDFIKLIYKLIDLIKVYWLYFLIFFTILYFIKLKRNYAQANSFLHNQTGFIILDGRFGAGKTRFMSQLAKEAKQKEIFVLSNFYNGYNFIKWNSLEDLRLLLEDVWALGELQNFTDETIKKIYIQDGKDEVRRRLAERKALRRKYKYIPTNGYNSDFLLLGDEFQNYFFNRSAMANFSGENSNLLKLFHQVRHFNTLVILATQNASELDVKFRRLSSYYINTGEVLDGLLYYYNVFSFEIDKENNLNLEKAVKFTKVPVFKINFFKLNNIFNYFVQKFYTITDFLYKKTGKKMFEFEKKKYYFSVLDFETKYNVNPTINTYTKGLIFQKLNLYYKNKI